MILIASLIPIFRCLFRKKGNPSLNDFRNKKTLKLISVPLKNTKSVNNFLFIRLPHHVFSTLPLVWTTFLHSELWRNISPISVTTWLVKQNLQEREIRLPLPIFWDSSLPLSSRALYSDLVQFDYPILHSPEMSPIITVFNIEKSSRITTIEDDTSCDYQLEQEYPADLNSNFEFNESHVFQLITPIFNSSLLDVLSLEPRWVLNITAARSSNHNLHRYDKIRDVTTDFPQLSAMYRKAKNHFNRFLAKLRRNTYLPPISPFTQLLQPILPYKNPNQIFDYWTSQKWIMRKIRFKPGISRVWRIARRDIKIILKFPVRYQHRLTWRLTKLARTRNTYVYYSLPHQLQYLLMRFRFTADILSSLKLLKRGAVFLNGFVCDQESTLLMADDRINLIISWEYYLITNKIAPTDKITTPLWFKLIKFRSFRSCYRVGKVWYPSSATNKFNHIISIWDDTPPFFQIDFFSLSCFILRETIYAPSSSLGAKFHTPVFILNMYNWKYIT